MLQITQFDEHNKPDETQKTELVHFLHTHLEAFGDEKEDIKKAIDYAVKDADSAGGFVLQAQVDQTPACVVVVNRTGMQGYIPENILVYIATNKTLRGQGIGKQMMLKALETAEGNVALHVEPNNPAKLLYEKLGFTNKYLEMRYNKKN